MTEHMRGYIDLLLAEDVRVEEWNDGTLSTAFDVASATWRVHYRYDNGWITIYAPLLALSTPLDAGFFRRLLNDNTDLLFMRYAVRERTVCLRGDISEQELNEAEFHLISRIAINAVKHAIVTLNLTTPPG